MAYARRHFGRFQGSQMGGIQRLMGALCFARRAAAGRPSPYADLLSEDLWGTLGGWVGGWGMEEAVGQGGQGWGGAGETEGCKRTPGLAGPLPLLSSLNPLPASSPHLTLAPPAARDFVRQCCVLLGQAQDSPLLVAVAAGGAALPTLLKLASVMGDQVGGGGNSIA